MLLKCITPTCGADFQDDAPRGYCDGCLAVFKASAKQIARAQRPARGVILTGQFAEPGACPKTHPSPITGEHVCGLCGGSGISGGYGHTGYGFGSYDFCEDCGRFLNFAPEPDDE